MPARGPLLPASSTMGANAAVVTVTPPLSAGTPRQDPDSGRGAPAPGVAVAARATELLGVPPESSDVAGGATNTTGDDEGNDNGAPTLDEVGGTAVVGVSRDTEAEGAVPEAAAAAAVAVAVVAVAAAGCDVATAAGAVIVIAEGRVRCSDDSDGSPVTGFTATSRAVSRAVCATWSALSAAPRVPVVRAPDLTPTGTARPTWSLGDTTAGATPDAAAVRSPSVGVDAGAAAPTAPGAAEVAAPCGVGPCVGRAAVELAPPCGCGGREPGVTSDGPAPCAPCGCPVGGAGAAAALLEVAVVETG